MIRFRPHLLRASAFLLTWFLLLPSCTGGKTPSETDTAPESGETPTMTETLPADVPTDSPETSAPAPETEPQTQGDEKTVVVPALYPTPKSISMPAGSEAQAVPAPGFYLSLEAVHYEDALTALGLTSFIDGLPLTVTLRDLSDTFDTCPDEGYILNITKDGVTLTGGSDTGVYYGLVTLAGLLVDGTLPALTVTDAPTMPDRGVIEGFYGTAWTHGFRLELFDFMGRQKMNTYIYAPKDDAKHRAAWRSLYTGEELERMRELVNTARENRVKFVYAISPGLDIDLGKGYEKDFGLLMAKCQQLFGLGVRDFAILLDDIPTLDAKGHARLLNDFQTLFCETHEGASDLIAITTEYCQAMLTDYSKELAPLLDPEIRMMWTGDSTVPASITPAQLRTVTKLYGRKVLIWWNYPVNDVLINNLYMDAARGNAAGLADAVTGFVANPMNQGHASLIPLFTTADYLWNPTAYAPDASLAAACKALCPDAADEMMTFIDLTGASPMNNGRESVTLGKLLNAYKKKPTDPDAARALHDALDALVNAAHTLREKADPAMTTEIARWIDKMEAFGRMGGAFLDMEAEAAGKNDLNALLACLDAYETASASIAGNSSSVSPGTLAPWLGSLAPRINELCGFTGGSTEGAGLTTNLPTYQDYVIDKAADGNDATFFWSAGAPKAGDYLRIDLGAPLHVTAIRLSSGVGGHTSDYFHNAELEYSVDGSKWTSLGKVTTPSLDKRVDLTARYIRLICRAEQTYWVTVSNFSVLCEEADTIRVEMDAPFVTETQLLTLTDGNILTGVRADPSRAEGHSLTLDVRNLSSLRLVFSSLPTPDAVTITLLDADGQPLSAPAAARDLHLNVTAAARVRVTFGGQSVTLAEIEGE